MRKKGLTLLCMILLGCIVCGFAVLAQANDQTTTFTDTQVSAAETAEGNTVVYIGLNGETTAEGTNLSAVLENTYLNGKALNEYAQNEVQAQYVTQGEKLGQIQLTFLNHAEVFKGDGKNILALKQGVTSDSGKVLSEDRYYRLGTEANVEIVPAQIESVTLNTAAASTGSELYLFLNFDQTGNNAYIDDIRGSLRINGVALTDSNYWEGNVGKQYNFTWPYSKSAIKNDRTDCITLPAGTLINWAGDGSEGDPWKEIRIWKDQTFYYYDGQWSETPSAPATDMKVTSFERTEAGGSDIYYIQFNKLFQTAATGGEFAKTEGLADKIKINGTPVSEIPDAQVHAWDAALPGRLGIWLPQSWSGWKPSGSNVVTLEEGLAFPDAMNGAAMLDVSLSETYTVYFNPALNVSGATAAQAITAEIGVCSNGVDNYVIKVQFKDEQGREIGGVQPTGDPSIAVLHRGFIRIDGVTLEKWATENDARINAWYGGDGALEIHIDPTGFNDLISPDFNVEVCDGYILVEQEHKVGSDYFYSYGGMVTKAVSKDFSMPTYKASGNTGDVFTRDMDVSVTYNPKGEHKIVLEFPSKAFNLIQGPWWNDAIKEMILINGASLAEMMEDAKTAGDSDGVRSYFNDGGYTVAGDFEIYISASLDFAWNLKGEGEDTIGVKRGMPLFRVNGETKEETLLGILAEDYEYTWEGVIKVENYLTGLKILSVSAPQISADTIAFTIRFDRDVCYGYMPHINAPADWLQSESEKVNASFYYSAADLTYITVNGVQDAVNDQILVNGKSLLDYNSGDGAHYPVAVMVHYGKSSADTLQIVFRTDMANGPDWSKETTLTITSGFVTPLGGKTESDIQFRLDAQTNQWSEVK